MLLPRYTWRKNFLYVWYTWECALLIFLSPLLLSPPLYYFLFAWILWWSFVVPWIAIATVSQEVAAAGVVGGKSNFHFWFLLNFEREFYYDKTKKQLRATPCAETHKRDPHVNLIKNSFSGLKLSPVCLEIYEKTCKAKFYVSEALNLNFLFCNQNERKVDKIND